VKSKTSQWVVFYSGKSWVFKQFSSSLNLKRRTPVRLFYVKDVLYAAGAWMHSSGDVHDVLTDICSVIAPALLYHLLPCRRPAISGTSASRFGLLSAHTTLIPPCITSLVVVCRGAWQGLFHTILLHFLRPWKSDALKDLLRGTQER